jgi:hypothetical protein
MSDRSKHAVSDLEYAIVTTMSNLLQGTEALSTYQNDAREAGDDEAAQIFGKIEESYRGYALELQAVLRRIATKG